MDFKKNIWVENEKNINEFSSEYWNNPEEEKKKIWGKWETNFTELDSKFKKKGLYQQYINVINNNGVVVEKKNILSLGAGICLLEAQILKKNPEIEKIINVEFSRHRIFEIAPNIFSKYSVDKNKVELVLGNFSEIKVDSDSVNIVLMSQAFHHADKPYNLLKEIYRVLDSAGCVIIIGEHYFSKSEILSRFFKHFIKYLINYKGIRKISNIWPSWRAMFPIDKIKGDHHYTYNQYKKMFNDAGFIWERYVFTEYNNQGFMLKKNI